MPVLASTTVGYTISAHSALPILVSRFLPAFRRSPIFRRCRLTGRDFPATSFKALAAPAIRSTTFRSACSGRTRGGVTPRAPLNMGGGWGGEFPPRFKHPRGSPLPAFPFLGLQTGFRPEKKNFNP